MALLHGPFSALCVKGRRRAAALAQQPEGRHLGGQGWQPGRGRRVRGLRVGHLPELAHLLHFPRSAKCESYLPPLLPRPPHSALLSVVVSNSWDVVSRQQPSESQVTCVANKNGSQANCELGNPFRRDAEVRKGCVWASPPSPLSARCRALTLPHCFVHTDDLLHHPGNIGHLPQHQRSGG